MLTSKKLQESSDFITTFIFEITFRKESTKRLKSEVKNKCFEKSSLCPSLERYKNDEAVTETLHKFNFSSVLLLCTV